MGQCGCGDFYPDKVYRLPDGTRVAVELYRGCCGCNTPAGVAVHFFAPGDDLFGLDDEPTEDVVPDEVGACVAGLPIMGVDDLAAACQWVDDNESAIGDYGNITDWLKDHGHAILRKSIFACRARHRNQ